MPIYGPDSGPLTDTQDLPTEYTTLPGQPGSQASFFDLPGTWWPTDFYGGEWDVFDMYAVWVALEAEFLDEQEDDGCTTTTSSAVVLDPAATPLNIGRAISLAGFAGPAFVGSAVPGVSYTIVDTTNTPLLCSAGAANQIMFLYNEYIKISELYVDVDVRAPIVLSQVEVDRTRSAAMPTIRWQCYDRDGDGQSAYQIRAFAAASVTDPDSDPSVVYDSGQVSTSVRGRSAVQLKEPLPPGLTTVYVRSAKKFRGDDWFENGTGLGGWVQMSKTEAGAATDWTVPSSAPSVPSISVAYDPTNYRNVITADSTDSLAGGFTGGTFGGSLRFALQVSTDGGVTWASVRGCWSVHPNLANATGYHSAGNAGTGGNGHIDFWDWEPIPNQVHTYRCRAFGVVAGHTYVSAWSSLVTVNPNITSFLIRDITDPGGWKLLPVADQPQETTKHPVSVEYPLGGKLPIVVLGTPTGRDWAITANITDQTDYDALRQLFNAGNVMVLYDPIQVKRYYVAISDDVTATHMSRPNTPWQQVPVTMVEVGAPEDSTPPG